MCRSSCAEKTASHVKVVTRNASDLHDLVVNSNVELVPPARVVAEVTVRVVSASVKVDPH